MNTEQINRVLHRIYGQEKGEKQNDLPAASEQKLIENERQGKGLLTAISSRSPFCAGKLGESIRRSEARLRALQSEHFLHTGNTCAAAGKRNVRNTGILSLLRECAAHYRMLASAYAERGYQRFSAESTNTAQLCESLLRRAMQ